MSATICIQPWSFRIFYRDTSRVGTIFGNDDSSPDGRKSLVMHNGIVFHRYRTNFADIDVTDLSKIDITFASSDIQNYFKVCAQKLPVSRKSQ